VTEPLVELQGVNARYRGTLALAEVDLRLMAHTLYALVGEHGSGKSTLLKLLSCRMVPSAGLVRFSPALGKSDVARARAVGYAAETGELDPQMTPREHLALFARLYGLEPAAARERIAQLAARFGLQSFLDQRVEACSGSVRKRLHLALSALHGPMLWLLDEPERALDPEGQHALWGALAQQTRAGGCAVVVCHDLARVAEHADQVLVLAGGKLVACEPTAALITRHGTLAHAYEALTGKPAQLLRPSDGRGWSEPRA
jgi:ABC-type multidrug transport system ATPase subunit